MWVKGGGVASAGGGRWKMDGRKVVEKKGEGGRWVGGKQLVERMEVFEAFTDRIFDCWDLVWVRREEVEEEEGKGGKKRLWLRL